MPTITLSTKVHNHHQLKLAEKFLKSLIKGLKVDTEISPVSREWIQLVAEGEDQKVALRYLATEIGQCPTHLEQIEKFSTAKGYIADLDNTGLQVDIGICSPSIIDTTIPLIRLQAQLVDGRKMAEKKIAELFGLRRKLPLTVKIRRIDEDDRYIEAMLPEKQLTVYRNWTKSLLDRLIVLGASSSEVRWALKRTRCGRDVVDMESSGFLEHAVVCKLGTDAVGLIPKIGNKLPHAKLTVFNPHRVLEFLGDYQIL